MAKIIPFQPAADPAAQHLHLRVAAASDAVAEQIAQIDYATVSGAETRAELSQVAELLTRARELLERVERREAPKYLRHSTRWLPP